MVETADDPIVFAAPLMLKALEDMMDEYWETLTPDEQEARIDRANLAIAKAKGEA